MIYTFYERQLTMCYRMAYYLCIIIPCSCNSRPVAVFRAIIRVLDSVS